MATRMPQVTHDSKGGNEIPSMPLVNAVIVLKIIRVVTCVTMCLCLCLYLCLCLCLCYNVSVSVSVSVTVSVLQCVCVY